MEKKKKKPKKKPKDDPLSLAPLNFDEAMRALVKVPKPPKRKKT